MQVGFKSEYFDVEIEEASDQEKIVDEEKLADKMMAKNGDVSTSKLYNLGIQLATAPVVKVVGKP